ncbi:leucine-rich repeat LGI family member 2-like [Brienomyrus brachyistius]|uniref:leucine-rich repeat LGI family member 2-like n=1 Tax=Brienomyrus brachyistius TaxID=42636 RepID=UPI0020B387A1|nr:leucine-rich repeat LGI family member 2-like [Brienomyrus brachyistius]XP_048852086.1 leucine-rich repeat LGI family member 2-like [Brienomyrus brachyistius]
MSVIKRCGLFCTILLCLAPAVHLKKIFRCPSACACSKESIVCVGSSYVPRIIPNDINSLSIVNGTFPEIKEAMFSHMPSLQLLLLNSNSFTAIRDDAFSGLPHLEYLFIESNKMETTTKHAFRGLRDLTHLSLANNNLKALPRDLFIDLDSLIELDLRGNLFECDCRAKWLMGWLKNTNATVSDIFCDGPADMKGKRLNDLASLHSECISTDFILHQSVGAESLSTDTFSYKNDVYVALAAPNAEGCMILQWDHIEMNFRTYDNITGQSIVGCKSVLINNQIFIIVAQLFGGSHIYKFDEDQNKFAKFQDIEVSKISKPNDIETFQIADEWFFVIADSSKAGLSTLYKWNGKGFYSVQTLHEWFRDTDAEFVNVDGKAYLILASRSQCPIIYQWNRGTQQFVQHFEIPNMEDVVAVNAFQMKEELYLAMTRYIGDSKVLQWTARRFTELQALPSRGSMILQPFSFKDRHYLALGSDYTFSQIHLWNEDKKVFEMFKEIYIQAPRSFTPVSTDRRNFIFSSSFKGNTQIFEHIIIDLSL